MTVSMCLLGLSFILASVGGLFLIPFLHKLKFGQEIREDGPTWHKKKSGTPTMGGIIFMGAMVVTLILGWGAIKIFDPDTNLKGLFLMLGMSLAFGLIGFLDDYIKVILKRNLGLTAKQKFSLQVIVSVVFAVWFVASGTVSTKIIIPFTEFELNLWYFYIPFIVFVILATVNSVNLTDGLDGLATSVTIVIALFYMIISNMRGADAVSVFSAALVGGLFGFLIFNRYPAKVFMGDTGSLFLGGAVCAMAMYMKQPITLILVGLVYVMESISVIIQVYYFKKTGKRIFKMSPIHHHFEMCGWSE
ncbi:MAG: phospho-N-acetylmuramoyl-pentapeptide-transferase, partial [Clostridia bacterium]|nr:phospho-N-acetylmuramoyl-pentapeptide-transferase [Clostridia bacterium]